MAQSRRRRIDQGKPVLKAEVNVAKVALTDEPASSCHQSREKRHRTRSRRRSARLAKLNEGTVVSTLKAPLSHESRSSRIRGRPEPVAIIDGAVAELELSYEKPPIVKEDSLNSDSQDDAAPAPKSKRGRTKRTTKKSPYFRPEYTISDRQAISEDTFGLLQEVYAPNTFRVLIVAMFLTQTPGHRARPFIQRFFEQYPDPETLSKANVQTLAEEIRPLGLHVIRAARFILFAKVYLLEPPIPGKTSSRKGIPKRLHYPPTEVSHLPGCGPYAMDCYRIFCTPDGWRTVRPDDKELKPYIQWRWAREGINYIDLWKADSSIR